MGLVRPLPSNPYSAVRDEAAAQYEIGEHTKVSEAEFAVLEERARAAGYPRATRFGISAYNGR